MNASRFCRSSPCPLGARCRSGANHGEAGLSDHADVALWCRLKCVLRRARKAYRGPLQVPAVSGVALGGARDDWAVQLGTLDIVNTSTACRQLCSRSQHRRHPILVSRLRPRPTRDGRPIGDDLRAKFPAKGLIALAWTENASVT